MNKNEQPQQPQGKLSAEEWFNESNFKKSYDVHALDEREIVYMLTKYLEYTEQFNKPTQKTLADLSYVPSQLCPKCHGKGFMQLSGTTSATTNICDVCGGNKIIYHHIHKPYYCKITGGLRCRKCKKLLNDFGNEYLNQTFGQPLQSKT